MYLHSTQQMQGIRQIHPKFLLKKTAINKLQTMASVKVYYL